MAKSTTKSHSDSLQASTSVKRSSAGGLFPKPNEAVSLVYDIYDGRGRLVPRQKVYKTPTEKQRRSPPKDLPKQEKIRVTSDGDSWVNILWPLSAVAGYDHTFYDIIELNPRFYATGTAYPGDTFQQVRTEKDYRQNVASESFRYFIVSAGGNDFIGGGALFDLLRWRDEGDGNDPTTHINVSWLQMSMDTLRSGYQEIADDVRQLSSRRTTMLVNTYDYPIPRHNGVWLGKPLERRGYNLQADKVLIAKIMKHLIDAFYATLLQVRHITVVDVRNTVKAGQWTDELHPKGKGAEAVAKKFMAAMGVV
ncbi:SGNH/GDSL hydrolase family protein [Mesorhizobium sp. M0589]|uniref:SGNH/GDSL hydrolase family protein n=1 Tax=Mesorhizobium sp. M0589 TaxID=2956965 RepID=UPI00333AF887